LLVAPLAAGPAAAARPIDRLRYQEYPLLEGKPVRQILILGNNSTQEVVFRREMTLAEGEPFRAALLWRDWENLVDLGIFANIEVDAVPSADGVLVVVSVYERPRWIIAPVLDYEITTKEVTTGFRLRVRNLGGLNQSFNSDGRFGARNRLGVSWSTPWLGDDRRSLAFSLDVEPPESESIDLRSNRISFATTRFLGDYRILRRGVTYFGRMEVLQRDGTAPGGGVQQLSPSVGAGYFRDSRNVRVDPVRGSLLSLSSEYASGWTTDEISYVRSAGDARKFVSVGSRLVLAGRAIALLTAGRVPNYRLVGVGGSSSIRGQPGDVAIGTNLARASLEVRFPLVGQRRFALPLPLVPKRIKNFDLRFDGVLFADAGAAWGGPSTDFDQTELKEGFGFGLRVFLPVFEVARIEIAFDEKGEPTFYFREGNFL
jgi:outer membrane protein insertion porin family